MLVDSKCVHVPSTETYGGVFTGPPGKGPGRSDALLKHLAVVAMLAVHDPTPQPQGWVPDILLWSG